MVENLHLDNTLLLGNGFSRAIFDKIPSWECLISPSPQSISNIKNYTFLYEMQYVSRNIKNEAEIKDNLIQKLKDSITHQNIRKEIRGLNKFGEYLRSHHIKNIITTNYDRSIEYILCNFCEYEEDEKPLGLDPEVIYSIRTYKTLKYQNGNHTLKLWKIHGDVNRTKSIMLGFDHYCGALAKLSSYIKGTYSSEHSSVKCSIDIETKCKNNAFDEISWAELFFSTNVFIIGSGLDFSEIDIWWLLNKHIRLKNKYPQHIQNNIYYFFNIQYDTPERKKDIYQMLDAFQIKRIGIHSDGEYIRNIFKQIEQCY